MGGFFLILFDQFTKGKQDKRIMNLRFLMAIASGDL